MNSAADSPSAGPASAPPPPFRRVLVAWDGSADSIAALRTASAMVGGQSGHVVALSIVAALPPREASNDQPVEQSAHATRLQAAFNAARTAIAGISNARIDLRTAEGRNVAGSICNYAVEHGFDLLVIGRHGEGGLMHPSLGHIAEFATRSCKVPVLLVSA